MLRCNVQLICHWRRPFMIRVEWAGIWSAGVTTTALDVLDQLSFKIVIWELYLLTAKQVLVRNCRLTSYKMERHGSCRKGRVYKYRLHLFRTKLSFVDTEIRMFHDHLDAAATYKRYLEPLRPAGTEERAPSWSTHEEQYTEATKFRARQEETRTIIATRPLVSTDSRSPNSQSLVNCG